MPQRRVQLLPRIRQPRGKRRLRVFRADGVRHAPDGERGKRRRGEQRRGAKDFPGTRAGSERRSRRRAAREQQRRENSRADFVEPNGDAAEQRGVERVVELPPRFDDAHRLRRRVPAAFEDSPRDGSEDARQEHFRFPRGGRRGGALRAQTDFRRIRRERQRDGPVRQRPGALADDFRSRGNGDAQLFRAERAAAVDDAAAFSRPRPDERLGDENRRRAFPLRQPRFEIQRKRARGELIRAEKQGAAAAEIIVFGRAERERRERAPRFLAGNFQRLVGRDQNRALFGERVRERDAFEALRVPVGARLLERRADGKILLRRGREGDRRDAVFADAPVAHVFPGNGKRLRVFRERQAHAGDGNAPRAEACAEVAENFLAADVVDAGRGADERGLAPFRAQRELPRGVADVERQLRRALGAVFGGSDFRQVFRAARQQANVFRRGKPHDAEDEMRLRKQARAELRFPAGGEFRAAERQRDAPRAEDGLGKHDFQQAVARLFGFAQLVARDDFRIQRDQFQLLGNEDLHFVERHVAHLEVERLRRRRLPAVENPADARLHDELGADAVRLDAEIFRVVGNAVDGDFLAGNGVVEKAFRPRERGGDDLRHAQLRDRLAADADAAAEPQKLAAADADRGERQPFPVRSRRHEAQRAERFRELAGARLGKDAQGVFSALGLAELHGQAARAVRRFRLPPRKQVLPFDGEDFPRSRHFEEKRGKLALRNRKIQLGFLPEHAGGNPHFGSRVERVDAGGKLRRRRDARPPAQLQRAARGQESGEHAAVAGLRDRDVVRREDRVLGHALERIRRDLRHGNAEIHAPPAVDVGNARVELQVHVEFSARGEAEQIFREPGFFVGFGEHDEVVFLREIEQGDVAREHGNFRADFAHERLRLHAEARAVRADVADQREIFEGDGSEQVVRPRDVEAQRGRADDAVADLRAGTLADGHQPAFLLRVEAQVRGREELDDAEERRGVRAGKEHRRNRRRQFQRLASGNRQREGFHAVEVLRANFQKRARSRAADAPVAHLFAGDVENLALPGPVAEDFERDDVRRSLQQVDRAARVDDGFALLDEKRLVERNLEENVFRGGGGNGGRSRAGGSRLRGEEREREKDESEQGRK